MPGANQSRASVAERLARRQDEVEREERRESIRILLAQPLLPAHGATADEFRLVRRHAEWLKTWFARWPGWTLVVVADIARLRKHPSPKADATRGLLEPSASERTPFTRRRYALLCLVLATLENEQRQTTLQQVACKVETAVRMDGELAQLEFEYDTRTLPHRRELVSVMRLLEQRQVLTRSDGDDKKFVTGDSDCLYRIDRSALAMLLCSVRSASTLTVADTEELIDQLNEVETPDAPEAQNRALQYCLVRRLLDDPVVYFDELTMREYEYFNSQGDRLLRELADVTGLVAERSAEGVALLDPSGGWTDVGLPETGTRGHSTLLAAEWLGQLLRESAEVTCEVSCEAFCQHIAQLAAENARYWRKESDTPEGIRRIAHDALEILAALGLIQWTGDCIRPRPAIARYRLSEPQLAQATKAAERAALQGQQANLWEAGE